MKEMAFVKIRLLVTVAMLLSSTLMGCHMESRNPPTSASLQVSMDDVLKQSSITQNVKLGAATRSDCSWARITALRSGGWRMRRSAIRAS